VGRLLDQARAWEHPLVLAREEPKKAEILILTSDRGLCGGFNSNLLRKVDHFLRHEGKSYEEVHLTTMGRKGREYYRAKHVALKESLPGFEEDFRFLHAEGVAQRYLQGFQAGDFDVLYLGFNTFKSAISQEPVLQQVLPLDLKPAEDVDSPPLAWEGNPR